MKTSSKNNFVAAVGRRKRSVARVRLFRGKGQSLVNNIAIADYFKSVDPAKYLKPFTVTETEGKYYITALLQGGGKSGQLGAFIHGVSRVLLKIDAEKYKKMLRCAGLLTRDPREKERRKFGLAQKARARKQSPKR